MKKPEKKPENAIGRLANRFTASRFKGYNQCWDDREKWLLNKLSIENLMKIIDEYGGDRQIALEIAKRIKDE